MQSYSCIVIEIINTALQPYSQRNIAHKKVTPILTSNVQVVRAGLHAKIIFSHTSVFSTVLSISVIDCKNCFGFFVIHGILFRWQDLHSINKPCDQGLWRTLHKSIQAVEKKNSIEKKHYATTSSAYILPSPQNVFDALSRRDDSPLCTV